MKEYLIKLLTAYSGLSSKRLSSLVGLMLFIISTILALCGVVIPDIYLYLQFGLITGQQVLTLFQKKSSPEES